MAACLRFRGRPFAWMLWLASTLLLSLGARASAQEPVASGAAAPGHDRPLILDELWLLASE